MPKTAHLNIWPTKFFWWQAPFGDHLSPLSLVEVLEQPLATDSTVLCSVPAVLAAVSVDPRNETHLVLQARSVVDLLLNATTKETLHDNTTYSDTSMTAWVYIMGKYRGTSSPKIWRKGNAIANCPLRFCHVSKFLSSDCLHYNAIKVIKSFFLILYLQLSLIHIWRCRRSTLCRSRWSPYH